MTALMGKLPTPAEYHGGDVYRYLNFNEIDEYQKLADEIAIPVVVA